MSAEPATASFTLSALRFTLGLVLRLLVAAPLWPLYGLLRLLNARPPVVVPWSRWSWAMGKVFAPTLARPWQDRVILALGLAQRGVTAPIWGLAWMLDELIYGRALDAVRVEAPIFEISAARSGSTQLARYLESDPRLCSPIVIQTVVPFMWFWALIPQALLDRVGSKRLTWLIVGDLPEDFIARHEVDVLGTDTFEVMAYTHHLGELIHQLGAAPFAEVMGYARVTPTSRAFWEEDFLPFFDRMARKTLYQAGPGRRLLIKGHFLGVAEALEARYPDARFLTMHREPLQRLRSALNYLHAQPADRYFPPLPWAWVVERGLSLELDYEEAERAWLARPEATRHLLIPFQDYVADLPGTLRRVYVEGMGMSPLETLPTVHAHRARSGYAVDRSLEDLGVDVAQVRARLEGVTTR
ncbi:sulfotransferase [Myxococcota bacterium]|nr:sulfotransferase [Myxococcota bacterium]